MNRQTNSIDFNQFVRIPLLGSTFVVREGACPPGLSFFQLDIERLGDITNEAGPYVKGAGPIQDFTLRAGRWVLIVERPCADDIYGPRTTLLWNQTAWLALGAPLIALVGIVSCLLASPIRHALERLWRPMPEAAEGPEA